MDVYHYVSIGLISVILIVIIISVSIKILYSKKNLDSIEDSLDDIIDEEETNTEDIDSHDEDIKGIDTQYNENDSDNNSNILDKYYPNLHLSHENDHSHDHSHNHSHEYNHNYDKAINDISIINHLQNSHDQSKDCLEACKVCRIRGYNNCNQLCSLCLGKIES